MLWKKHHDHIKKTSGSFHKIFLKFFISFFLFDFFVEKSVKKPDKYDCLMEGFTSLKTAGMPNRFVLFPELLPVLVFGPLL